jgi:hypothetical protein
MAWRELRAAPAVPQTQTPAPPVTPVGLPLSPLAAPPAIPAAPPPGRPHTLAMLRDLHHSPYGAPPRELTAAA